MIRKLYGCIVKKVTAVDTADTQQFRIVRVDDTVMVTLSANSYPGLLTVEEVKHVIAELQRVVFDIESGT